jgi:hypothetical protein
MKWIIVALVLGAIAADLVAGLTGTSLTFAAGLCLVYAGERLFGEETLRWVFSIGGVVVALVAIGVRTSRWARSEGSRRDAQQKALIFSLVALSSVGLYALSLQAARFGLLDESAVRFAVVLQTLTPIVAVCGVLPMFMLDQTLSAHPVVLPKGAANRTIGAGLSAALGIAMVFPLNYLANAHSVDKDVAYFRTTRPGESTLSLVRTLSQPVKVSLFFPPGSSVAEELKPYFQEIADASGGKLTWEQVDQAVDPKRSEELKVRENGTVVFQQGEASEKLKLGTDFDKAKKDLKKLDQNVQKNLLKVSRGARVAYLTVGHGEASTKEKDDDFHKLSAFKNYLESQNYKVKNLGANEGLTNAVPDDASVVIIAAPEKPLMAEEEASINAYLQRGGRLLAMTDPERDPLDGVLGKLGLQAGHVPLANAKFYLSTRQGKADRVLLVSNRFGSHDAVKSLATKNTEMFVGFSTVAKITEVPGGMGKATVLIRAPEGTWEDADGDREQGAAEKSESYNLGYAVSGDAPNAPKDATAKDAKAGQFRAIVVGDVSLLSDPIVMGSAGNQQFALDALRWLIGDDDISGDVKNEEDVKIEHTKEQDVLWFYATLGGVPLMVLIAGFIVNAGRNRRSK